jgi:hypothetical protein
MRGVITSRDVLTHAGLICREFGLGCIFRCIAAVVVRRKTTFLEIAVRCS